jgi:hypothetical protein
MKFQRNEHGHLLLNFVSRNLTGNEEVKQLEGKRYFLTDEAKGCLASSKLSSYDKCHRLTTGGRHTVAIVFEENIPKDMHRSTASFLQFGLTCGYGKPTASHLLRVCELVDAYQMRKEMEINYILAPHDGIKMKWFGHPHVFVLDEGALGNKIDAVWDDRVGNWAAHGIALIFTVPDTN